MFQLPDVRRCGPLRPLEGPVGRGGFLCCGGTIGGVVGGSRTSQAGDGEHGNSDDETIGDGLAHGLSMPDFLIGDRESRGPGSRVGCPVPVVS